MLASQQQAIRSADQAYEDYMSRWLDQLTDTEEVDLNYALREHYQKKHNFLVFEHGINQWIIASGSPCFYPNCTLVDHLQQEFFTTVEIDDDHHLIVSVPHPCNSMDDADYIAESFDTVLEWLPKWEKAQAAYIVYMDAKENWEKLQAALSA